MTDPDGTSLPVRFITGAVVALIGAALAWAWGSWTGGVSGPSIATCAAIGLVVGFVAGRHVFDWIPHLLEWWP